MVASLGTQAVVLEADVYAENWLAALRAGREQLGDPGGIPPGASCLVADRGEVIVVDAKSRRRYTLTPAPLFAARQQARRPPPRPSRPPTLEPAAPPPASVLDADPSPPASNELAVRAASASHQLDPLDARSAESEGHALSEAPAETAAPPDAPTQPTAHENVPQHEQLPAHEDATPVRDQQEPPVAPESAEPSEDLSVQPTAHPSAEALRSRRAQPTDQENATPIQPASPPAHENAEPGEDPSPPPAHANETPLGQREELLARENAAPSQDPSAHANASPGDSSADDVPAEGEHAQPADHASAQAAAKSARRKQTLAYSAARADSLRREYELARSLSAAEAQGSVHALAPLSRGASSNPPPPRGTRPPPAKPAAQLVHAFARDVEPTPESPITYRERAYLVSPSTHVDKLEGLLQAELLQLRSQLSDAPRGQLIHLAVFDKPLRESSHEPPLATLEWSDWRGNAVFVCNANLAPPRAQSELPSSDSHVGPVPRAASDTLAFAQTEPPPASPRRSALASTAKPLRDDSNEADGRLAQAFEALPDLYFLPTPVAGLEFATKLITRLVPCAAISVCIYDINTDEFRFVAVRGPGSDERRASAIPSQAGLFGVAKRGVEDSLVIANALRDTRYRPAIDGRANLDVLDLAYLPLRKNRQLLGMVQLLNRAGELGFTKADVAVLNYVATQLTDFLVQRRGLGD